MVSGGKWDFVTNSYKNCFLPNYFTRTIRILIVNDVTGIVGSYLFLSRHALLSIFLTTFYDTIKYYYALYSCLVLYLKKMFMKKPEASVYKCVGCFVALPITL